MGRITVFFAMFAPTLALAQVGTPIPEPSAFALIAAGGVVAGIASRLARKKREK